MVELFAAAGFASSPRSKSAPVRPVARLETPHAGRVGRSPKLRTPRAGLRLFIEDSSPALNDDGLETTSRFFRIAPAHGFSPIGQVQRDRFASDRNVGLLGER